MTTIMKQVKAALAKYDEAMVVLINSSKVVSVTVVNEQSEGWLKAVSSEYDSIELVGESDRPAPGWKFDGKEWQAPPVTEPTSEEIEATVKPQALAEAAEQRRRSMREEAERILADPYATFADRVAAQDLLDRGR